MKSMRRRMVYQMRKVMWEFRNENLDQMKRDSSYYSEVGVAFVRDRDDSGHQFSGIPKKVDVLSELIRNDPSLCKTCGFGESFHSADMNGVLVCDYLLSRAYRIGFLNGRKLFFEGFLSDSLFLEASKKRSWRSEVQSRTVKRKGKQRSVSEVVHSLQE